MPHPVLLLVPAVLAATRSLAFGIQSRGESGARSAISTETEYEMLVVVIFCLTGLLVSLCVMTEFPNLGAIVAEMNQF
jgi:hypothetical protein